MVNMRKILVITLLIFGMVAEDTSTNKTSTAKNNTKENSEGKNGLQLNQKSDKVQQQGKTTQVKQSQSSNQAQLKSSDNGPAKNNSKIQQRNNSSVYNASITSTNKTETKNIEKPLDFSVFDEYEFFELDDLFKPENQDQEQKQNQAPSNNSNTKNIQSNQTTTTKPQNKEANSRKDIEKFLEGLYEENFDDIGDYGDYQYYGEYGYYGGYDFEGTYQKLPHADDQQDYFKDVEEVCYKNDKGESVLNASIDICDVKIEGADKYPMSFEGGIDGFYFVNGCYDGRPVYIRREPENYQRVLWWSKFFGDWDISSGTTPNHDDILCHGGQHKDEERPNFVNLSSWALSQSIITTSKNYTLKQNNKAFKLIKLNVTCSDGKKLVQPESSIIGKQPLLTDEEMEQQYRIIYQTYAKQNTKEPEINFVLVMMMMLAGMGVIFGVPYMVVKRTGRQKNKNQKSDSIMKTCQQLEKQRIRKL